LYDAQRVNPNEMNSETAYDVDGILERLWQRQPRDVLLEGGKGFFGGA
jgi:hypothetical protein